jgi:arylesterase / paraoxonase
VPFVSERYFALWILIKNQPGWLPTIATFSEYKVKLEEVVRNCEDVVLDESHSVAILSCDPGRDKWNTVMVQSL